MRNYKRKTERDKVSIELLQRAADAVIEDGRKLKTVARELEICHMTLFRFVKKLKAGVTPTVGYYSRQVFNQDQEKTLADYLLKCSSIYFGLLPEELEKEISNVKTTLPPETYEDIVGEAVEQINRSPNIIILNELSRNRQTEDGWNTQPHTGWFERSSYNHVQNWKISPG
ncbi:hypothetical protein JTB14_035536 [Gonioctena quinquepunctata]|nr:hypothetical protein JTB14_035536 [Gonioctena quinquepunctata]